MRRICLTAAAVLAAVLSLSGCATKSSVQHIDTQVRGLQNEWQAFEQGYDPAMRRELETNLQTLQALNDEVALLRDEVNRKAQRVGELLRQIDDNELDKAVQSCRRYAEDADYFAATAQRHADGALSYLEETRQTTRYAMTRHLDRHHRVDATKLLKKIERLEAKLAKLEHALQRQQDNGHSKEKNQEARGRRD